MALLNEILGVAARFNALLTRKFQITGGAPAPQLTPEIVPTMPFITDAADALLQGERYMGGFVNATGAVGKNGTVRLRNPANSGYVCIVDRIIMVSLGATDDFVASLQIGAADLAQQPAAPGIMSRDTRVNQSSAGSFPGKGVGIISWDNSPPGVLAGSLFAFRLVGSTPGIYDQPIILAPNSSIDVFDDALNTAIFVSFAWKERPLTLAETGPF